MNTPYPTTGLWMLALLALLIARSGLPVWVLLVGTASAFAGVGWLLGLLDASVLSAVGARTLGLLEHDLLQALPLYVFVGVLLQRLTWADTLFAVLSRITRRSGAASSLAAFGVAALVAPMNGSVASSSAMLARLVSPHLGRGNAATSTALVSAASTIGVVVPPSLVLILLGDAMLRAHTEASNLPGFVLGSQRIVNTQDVFNAALAPALGVLLLWVVVVFWQGRKRKSSARVTKPRWTEEALSLLAVLAIVSLLAAVFTGKMFAVEAAATGGTLLLMGALATRSLSGAQWAAVLTDALALTGALFALLVGASTFSLIFRLLGTDRWIAELLLGSTLAPMWTALLVLLAVALCAWVLDAFEMIFVVIPIVAPPLIFMLGDAQQAAVLLLLVLQLSFLIPPMGYAVLIARARSGLQAVATGTLIKALLPYILVQCAVTAVVFVVPWTVHQLDAPSSTAADTQPMSEQELERRMQEMVQQNEPLQAPPEPAVMAK